MTRCGLCEVSFDNFCNMSGNIANLDEAEKCRELGKSFLRAGEWAKAVKFFDKSLRLYSLPGVEAMRDRAQASLDKPASASSSSSSGSSASTSSGTRQGTTSTSSSSSSGGSGGTGSSGRSYTAEQEKGAKEILVLGKKSHYKVLGLSNGASGAEVKKAYRKQSLRYHPDKNSAPSAENAFKTINSAYDVLSDKEKRNIYDQVGHENADQAMNGGGGGGGGGGGFGGSPFGGGHGDLNPEDLFNMFFQGGGGPQFRQQRGGRGAHFFHQSFGVGGGGSGGQRADAQRRNGQERTGDQESRPQLGQLLQILPMLIIFFLSFGSFGGNQQQQPLFSLHKSPTYIHSMKTSMGSHVLPGTQFYASQELWSVHNRKRLSDFDRLKIERDVHNQYSSMMHSNCLKENNRNKRFQSNKDTAKCDDLGKFQERMKDWQKNSQGSNEF